VGARVVLSLEGTIVSEVELAKAVTIVGRHPACDICIDHPAISARHMLFRVEGSTVYMEDLASTNGTKVNGIASSHQVVHHLDLIEVGKHRLHFFDDAMLAGSVGNLESTVLTEFERTMMVAHMPAPVHEPAPAARPAARGGEDLSRTMAIARDPQTRLGPAQEAVRTSDAQAPGMLALRGLAGPRKGEIVALEQANTMIGTGGGESALVVKRGARYFLARFSGTQQPRLNRAPLGAGSHPIAERDVIEVGDASFEVILVTR
jgi:hypothetical protein